MFFLPFKSPLLLLLTPLLLTGCISLPKETTSTARHYHLLPAESQCHAAKPANIKLAVTKVASGLNGNRIIQASEDTGEIMYLSNMRWPNETQAVLEQRLAQDLESVGFSIITSHHQTASMALLNCELRALNLIEKNSSRHAQFSLSCNLRPANSVDNHSIISHGSSSLESLKSERIIKALSTSYQQGFNNLCMQINQQLTP